MKHRILQSLVIPLVTAAWLAVPVMAAEEDLSFEAVKFWAEQGYMAAQYNLGVRYDNGEGVPENDAEAVKWYRLAAEQGNALAQNNLGFMYDNGTGVSENDSEAIKWYRLSAIQGNAMAQHNLGLMYLGGSGVPQNLMMAYVWLSVAAALGDEDARTNRDTAANQLTPEQLTKGQEIATRCFESGYKD